jgi:ribonuclease P protein component
MLGRVVHRADFERLLASVPLTRSAHFAVHHVTVDVGTPRPAIAEPREAKLSTRTMNNSTLPVDDLPAADSGAVPGSGPAWLALGIVVPKRHARRAVTRNLIRRLARLSFARHRARLEAGLWLIRLRAPFVAPAGADAAGASSKAGQPFVSARSRPLARAVGAELEQLVMGIDASPPPVRRAPRASPRRVSGGGPARDGGRR